MRLFLRTITLCELVLAAGSASHALAQSTLVQWNFNNQTTQPSTVDPNFLTAPTVSTFNVGTTSFQTVGNNGSSDPQQLISPAGNYALQASGWPAQGTGNDTAGYLYTFNTTNYTLNDFSWDQRDSGGPSGWAQLQYSVNGGSTWETMSVPNPTNSPNIVDASGSSTSGHGTFIFFPNDHWSNQNAAAYNQPIDLTQLPDYSSINNNPNFEIREVAAFSPVAFSDSNGAHAANTAYMRADSSNPSTFAPVYTSNGTSYTNTSTWRVDMVTLTGTYNPPVFTPVNLTWNAGSGTWDTIASNKPWLNGATPSPFHQNGGLGDNVTFNNPTSGSVVTIQAGGVTPNSMNVATNGTLTFTGGGIGGTGALTKTGTGTLVLDNTNTFTGASGGPSSITGGILETHKTSPLGTGAVSLTNTTWNATTNNQTSAGTVTLNGAVNINTTSNLNLSGGLAGAGTLNKGGAGTLEVGGIGTNTGTITVTQGTVQLDSMNALGGNPQIPSTAPVESFSNSALIFNSTGKPSAGQDAQLSNNVTLTNTAVSRNDLNNGQPGSSTSNGDSVLTSYDSNDNFTGGILTVNGSSSFTNNEHRTAAVGDSGGVGSGGSSNQLVITMPTLITSGATLTANATNGSLSVLNPGGPVGTLSNTAVAFHGESTLVNPNHTIALQAGATLAMIGAGEKRIGSGSTGVPMIGLGTSASESTFKADTVTFMTDLANAANNDVNSLFIVAGSGTGGLRIEAPLNANYTTNPNNGQIATTGLLGNNPDTSMTTAGNVYTIMSPNRYAGLSGWAGMPTQTPDGAALPALGGTITLAGSDSGTGAVDNGPAAGTAVRLGLDNTSTSGTITYTIDPSANSGAVANFGGLVLKQTNTSASLTTELLGNTTLLGANPAATTFTQSGQTFNLNGHTLTVGGAATISGGTVTGATGSGLTAGSITFTGGTIAPSTGPSTPSTITLTGNTTLGAGSSLSYELGTPGVIGSGTNSLTEVHGTLTLGGTLNVTGLSGYHVGAYRLLDYTVSLTNNGLSLGSLPAGFAGTHVDTSHAGQVNLDVMTIAGDVNGDHIVNGQDIAVIASHWLQTGFSVAGDANFDGIVNGQDIAQIASHWLQTGGSGSGGSGSAVPEPGAYALCLTGMIVGLGWRLRQRRSRG